MQSVVVQDQSQVAEARRRAAETAKALGFGSVDAGRIALVVTELATNLIKHGRGGEILVGAYEDIGNDGVEVLALDQGPGMHDVASCLEDGYSSAGTGGRGLGAVIRQSTFVDVASWAGAGTAVLARVAVARSAGKMSTAVANWGAVSVPKPGQEVCGDAWSVSDAAAGPTLLVADGLGHGPEASEAAVAAVRLFHRFNGHRIPILLDYLHGGLRATRGAAVSIARFDRSLRKVIYGGVGNVTGLLSANGELRRMVSMPGTAGHIVRKIQTFDYPFTAGLAILHSDGLTSNWMLDRYPGLDKFHPTLIAGLLYRDHRRGLDDATVLVAKW